MPETSIAKILDHHRQFLAFVERRVPDSALAEDILQAAYLRALRHEADLDRNESVVAWFYRVLRNAVIDFYRRRSTEDRAVQAWGRDLETSPTPTPEDENELCACLTAVLNLIRPAYAELLRAVDLAGQPLQAFAQAQNISASNAAVRAHRARAALRRQLIVTCGACARHACIQCTCRAAD